MKLLRTLISFEYIFIPFLEKFTNKILEIEVLTNLYVDAKQQEEEIKTLNKKVLNSEEKCQTSSDAIFDDTGCEQKTILLPDKFTLFLTFFTRIFLKFLIEQVKSKLFGISWSTQCLSKC